ncbi:hypothetical protein DENIS_3088 [Desulfonema ishimotonii]|uniref:Uncharacterized protein n=1 Tax=Desulfonema ishimotonii TaxID=45657 RepID=A0A401FYT6_9BACT|nr:hypothetical protein [Desulfonema ishimotonii]GBC62125.1 hypothetical protein DENIS_3088 [Desulfonema ishimotonii]
MNSEITVAHSKAEFDRIQHIKARALEESEEQTAVLPDDAADTVSEKLTQTTDVHQSREEDIMATAKPDPKAAPSQEAAPKTEQNKKSETGEPVSGEQKLASDLLQHLTATKMTAGQLDLLLEKLELQFDHLVHGQLVGKLKQTDNYTFAKEYLDMEIQPMKEVMERMKRLIGVLQDKQITLADDLAEVKQEIHADIAKVRTEIEAAVDSGKKESRNGIERQSKTVSAKVDHEIQRLNHNIDDQMKGFRNELTEALQQERRESGSELKTLRSKFESDTDKLRESLVEKVRQEGERVEAETRKIGQEAADARQKVQDSLHTLSEYLLLVIEAAGLRDKIEKLSYDKSLEEMKNLKL